ncbi:MAG: ATP-grasp domain-containing protein, partial [Spirochaetia bacterium]|nr:ATP-grasp domain-containing protein [Spirochaetia bacterium]
MASDSFITRMKVLIVGSGGREHALACALKKSRHNLVLYCIGSNAGISQIATMVAIPLSAHQKIVDYAKETGIEYVVIGPDEPLVNGLADLFTEASIPCFGPSRKAARIEGSKAYAKEFMKAHQIPTPAYQVFDEVEPAKKYLEQCSYPLVIKADGLAFGKGVIIAQSQREAEQALEQMMVQRSFGDSGSIIVIEEFVTGEEVSLLVFSDGVHAAAMVSSMDHKRAGDGDTGLNT